MSLLHRVRQGCDLFDRLLREEDVVIGGFVCSAIATMSEERRTSNTAILWFFDAQRGEQIGDDAHAPRNACGRRARDGAKIT